MTLVNQVGLVDSRLVMVVNHLQLVIGAVLKQKFNARVFCVNVGLEKISNKGLSNYK